jgi:RNA polymerase-binding protein DksA
MSVGVDVERMRRELEAERERLLAALESVNHTESLTEETGDLATGPGDHLADNATETYMRELDHGIEESTGRLLGEIEAALGRIADGTYGTCSACGRPIEPERLEAVPYASLCIEDKRAQERG